MRVGFEVRETVAMFRRILDGFAEWVRPEPAPPQVAPPEPSVEFSHPKNAELFTLLKRWWFESSTRSEGEYLRVHPDLIERFRNLAATSNVRQGAVYLRAVIANQSGLIFAWATGMNGIFLRLPRQLQQAVKPTAESLLQNALIPVTRWPNDRCMDLMATPGGFS